MSKLRNTASILLTLVGDVAVIGFWYVIAFPSEPTEALVTMGMTLLATLFAVVFGFMSYAVYEGCVADD